MTSDEELIAKVESQVTDDIMDDVTIEDLRALIAALAVSEGE